MWRDFSDGRGDDGPSNQSISIRGHKAKETLISTSMRSLGLVDASLADEEVELPEGHVTAVSSSMRSLAEEEVSLPPDYVGALTTSMRSLAEEEVSLPPDYVGALTTSMRSLAEEELPQSSVSGPRSSSKRRRSNDDDGGNSSYIDAMRTSFRSLVDEEVKNTADTPSPDSSNELPKHHESATMTSSVVNLLNTIAGAGMLGLPGAFAKSGFAGGSILLVASCFFSAMGLRLLAISAEAVGVQRDRPSSFFSVANAALPRLTVVIDVTVALKCFGVAVSYFITVGDSMVDASKYLLRDFGKKGHWFETALTSRHFWISIALVSVTPISFHRTLDSLKFVSALSLQLKVALVVGVILYAEGVFDPCEGLGDELVTSTSKSGVEEKDSIVLTEPGDTASNLDDYGECRGDTELFTDFESTFISLPIFVFAYTCHQNIFPVLNEMKYRTQTRVDRVVFFTTGCSLVLFLVIAVEGYKTFGSNVKGDILLNYPQTALLTAMRIFVSATVQLSYPLQLDPCRRCIGSLIRAWKRAGYFVGSKDANTSTATLADEVSVSQQEVEKLRRPDDESSPNDEVDTASEERYGSESLKDGATVWLTVKAKEAGDGEVDECAKSYERAVSSFEFNGTTLIILALSFLVAMVATDLGAVLVVVGASGSTIVTFILPGAIYLRLSQPTFHLMKALAFVQLLLGLVILPTALYLVISRSMSRGR